MTFPTVTKLPQKLEPLTEDTFVVSAASGRDVLPAGGRRIVD